MTGRPGHWSERGEYNILFLGSILVISSQDPSAPGYREFTEEGPMTISPFAAREGTSAPQWPNVKKCCRHLAPSSDFFVQSYAVPILGTLCTLSPKSFCGISCRSQFLGDEVPKGKLMHMGAQSWWLWWWEPQAMGAPTIRNRITAHPLCITEIVVASIPVKRISGFNRTILPSGHKSTHAAFFFAVGILVQVQLQSWIVGQLLYTYYRLSRQSVPSQEFIELQFWISSRVCMLGAL